MPISQCVYCGTDLTDANFSDEHVIPLSRGGSNDRSNRAPACQTCNNLKGCLTASEFLAVRDDFEDLMALRRLVDREVELAPPASTARRRKGPEPTHIEKINRKAERARDRGHDNALRAAAAARLAAQLTENDVRRAGVEAFHIEQQRRDRLSQGIGKIEIALD